MKFFFTFAFYWHFIIDLNDFPRSLSSDNIKHCLWGGFEMKDACQYFFGSKSYSFIPSKQSKNLDPSFKTDLDYWIVSEETK